MSGVANLRFAKMIQIAYAWLVCFTVRCAFDIAIFILKLPCTFLKRTTTQVALFTLNIF